MTRNPHKEPGPGGRPRWKRRLRKRPWKPRVPACRTCAVCGKNVTRKNRLAVAPAVVRRCVQGELVSVYLAGGGICRSHTEVYLPDPCPCGGADLFRLLGPRYAGGRLLDGAQWVTWQGEVVRECPVCECPLPQTSTQEATRLGEEPS